MIATSKADVTHEQRSECARATKSDEAKRRQNDHFHRVQWWFEQEQKIPFRFTPFLKVEE
jgi:hypothetical protein